jgi:hypothetical protein
MMATTASDALASLEEIESLEHPEAVVPRRRSRESMRIEDPWTSRLASSENRSSARPDPGPAHRIILPEQGEECDRPQRRDDDRRGGDAGRGASGSVR